MTSTAGFANATLSGSIDQKDGGETSSGQFTTAVFHVTNPATAKQQCYLGVPDIPAQGFVQGTSVTLNSYYVQQQGINFTGTADAADDAISGNYSVNGGCAGGDTGSFSIVRYAPLTGTYAGTVVAASGTTAAVTATLPLTQMTTADGYGAFELDAAGATFTGLPCSITTGTTSGNPTVGKVIGDTMDITLYTNDASGGTLEIAGIFDQAADTISNVTYTIHGGSCAAAAGGGSGTLTLQ